MKEGINRLTILEYVKRNNGKRAYYVCECLCGNIVNVRKDHYNSDHTRSCGCLFVEGRHKGKHNGCNTRLYNIWGNMKQRCSNEKNTAYIYYGGKGIKVCMEWKLFPAFKEWAMANGYSEELTIDRKDSNKGYFPSNCEWISRRDNTRKAHLGKKHIRRRD